MAVERGIEPHGQYAKVGDAFEPARIIGEFLFDEVQFDDEEEQVVFVDEEYDSKAEYLPVVEDIKKTG
jgi:hypothetical protein